MKSKCCDVGAILAVSVEKCFVRDARRGDAEDCAASAEVVEKIFCGEVCRKRRDEDLNITRKEEYKERKVRESDFILKRHY